MRNPTRRKLSMEMDPMPVRMKKSIESKDGNEAPIQECLILMRIKSLFVVFSDYLPWIVSSV